MNSDKYVKQDRDPSRVCLPETQELKEKKELARKILRDAFRLIHEKGLMTVNFDSEINHTVGICNISFITQEEWKHGTWRG